MLRCRAPTTHWQTVIETAARLVPRDPGPVVSRVVQAGEFRRSQRVKSRNSLWNFPPSLTSIHMRRSARLLTPLRLPGFRHRYRDGLLAAFDFASGAALEFPPCIRASLFLPFPFVTGWPSSLPPNLHHPKMERDARLGGPLRCQSDRRYPVLV